ncbi:MAG: four helix bundle protein [Bacteroidales bacterium]|nr:four helix bundle protein [Bacteroidales bacterium]
MIVELEFRVIKFASLILHVCDTITYSDSGRHLKSQLIRSGTSVALNYGEARSSESRKDLYHKLSIIVKELRETQINLKLLSLNNLSSNNDLLDEALNENGELIAIFVTSLQTIKKRIVNK